MKVAHIKAILAQLMLAAFAGGQAWGEACPVHPAFVSDLAQAIPLALQPQAFGKAAG